MLERQFEKTQNTLQILRGSSATELETLRGLHDSLAQQLADAATLAATRQTTAVAAASVQHALTTARTMLQRWSQPAPS